MTLHRLFKFTVQREEFTGFPFDGRKLDDPSHVASFLSKYTRLMDREHFFTFSLDLKLRVIGFETVAIGGIDSVSVHPVEVFRGAIIAGASSIIVAHNHPSGDPRPSPSDMELAKDLARAGKVLDVPVQDFLIISKNGTHSIAEGGLIV